MKTIFTLLLLTTFAFKSPAQTNDKEEYLTARTVPQGWSRNYLLYVDYSEAKGKDYIDPTDAVYDNMGNRVKFKSESAALNYLASQSWIIVSALPVYSAGTATGETKYIFKRKISLRAPLVKPVTAE